MRLKYIKLAGFKSFVDATKVPFPDQMTCVVGPNGCGKSNVIDAVRWVLGESSAKNLRGDAMTDVIFNGSSARKPVSRASVELVFDNTERRLQGEFANYNEISVKRLVTRDGQSNYFLNGSKCRRRDITDLFLGTGLGPRSYAIIEQGMISRLIESRPQELRVFIEEAAGISKYKERRKETESRMRKTRENLERLTDVREELSSQLAKLQRQAAAAKRYKTLKSEERQLRAQLQALRWVHYQQQYDRVEQQLQQQQTELERWIAEQRGSERGQTSLRERQTELKDQLDLALQRFYQCNNDITQIEQSLRHQQQMSEKRRKDADDTRMQIRELETEQAEEQTELELLDTQLKEIAPELEIQHAQLEELEGRLLERDERIEQLQRKREQRERATQDAKQQAAVYATQAEGIDNLLTRLRQQLRDVTERLQQYDDNAHRQDIEQAEQALLEREEQLAQSQETLLQAESDMAKFQQQLEQAQQNFQQAKSSMEALQAQSRSYQQLVDSVVQETPEDLEQWLEGKQWQPLHQLVEVESSWQHAVELIAKPWLSAPVLLNAMASEVFSAPREYGQLLVVDTETQVKPGSLAEKIDGPAAHLAIFQHIAALDDTQDIAAQLDSSGCHLAVDRQGGLYCRDGWLKQSGDNAQLLGWQKALQSISKELPELEQTVEQEAANIAQCQQQLSQVKDALNEARQAAHDAHQLAAEKRLELSNQQRRREELKQRQQEYLQQRSDLELNIAEQDEKRHTLLLERESVLQGIDAAMPDVEAAEAELSAEVSQRKALAEQRQQLQQQGHQLTLREQQAKQGVEHLQRNLNRAADRLAQLEHRLVQLSEPDETFDDALERAKLEEALIQREDAEVAKNRLADQLAEVESELDTLNQGQQGVERKIEEQRSLVEASKMELTAARERGNSLLEGMQETGYGLKEVLSELPAEANEQDWQQRLDKIGRSLQQLGAINLAAIEEAEAQAERKAYLDAQYTDLMESLTLLEDAIKKIDKETRQRFRKTFEQVNSDLGQLFPKVFGGGSAYLALTDDDLLETGVTIMARPPGKKNSTIHLLSGGEKALTALSLVFAIFRLNPAPFCMLDEVDAPLDDANVGRFCRLVQEMSESVQFIYISHNKIAMEMATHLAGVTMQEPGVSRLVAVDVDAAVAMAEAS